MNFITKRCYVSNKYKFGIAKRRLATFKRSRVFIKDSGIRSEDGSIEYVICSRLTGNHLQLGIFGGQTGNGGPVVDKYPNVTPYNRWRLIPIGGTSNVRYAWLKYDNTCITANISVNTLETAFKNATEAIEDEFGIEFRIITTSYTDDLDGYLCPNSNSLDPCNDLCGTKSNCDTTHHKNSSKLLGSNTSSGFYTVNMVGHMMCGYNNPNHVEKYGTAWTQGHNSIVTYQSPDFESTIQHELSHNLGATHNTCNNKTTAICVLKDQNGLYHAKNVWCENCENAIIAFNDLNS